MIDYLTLALDHADKGYYVVPARPDKRPYTARGYLDGTRDPERITKWWTRHPEALPAVVPGMSNLAVVDVDGKEGQFGYGSAKRLGLDFKTEGAWTSVSMSGQGKHVWFAGSAPESKPAPGIDVKSLGGYCIELAPLPDVCMITAPTPTWAIVVASSKPDADVEAWLADHTGTMSESVLDVLDSVPDPFRGESELARVVSSLVHCASRGAVGVTDGLSVAKSYWDSSEHGESAYEASAKFDRMVTTAIKDHGSPFSVADLGGMIGDWFKSRMKPGDVLKARAPEHVRSTGWEKTDHRAVFTGDYVAPVPDIWSVEGRSVGMFLTGRSNGVWGHSGHGKSWFAKACAADVIASGGNVLYLDCEADADEVLSHLRLLGVTVEDFDSGAIDYRRLHAEATPEQWSELMRDKASFQFVVIDGLNSLMTMLDMKTESTEDVNRLYDRVIDQICKDGPALLWVDHVPKNSEVGEFPFGSQAKRSRLTGTGVWVERIIEWGPGAKGHMDVYVSEKDRVGRLHAEQRIAGETRGSDAYAHFVVDATVSGSVSAKLTTVDPAGEARQSADSDFLMKIVNQFRATGLALSQVRAVEFLKAREPDLPNEREVKRLLQVAANLNLLKMETGSRGAFVFSWSPSCVGIAVAGEEM